MQFEKYVNRMQYLQELIEKQSTGTPRELAKRLGISERMLYHYIIQLKQSRSIIFNAHKKSYVYDE